tara:strand:+ start:3078 stop:3248 length:171 start_codon:yes stop_codon:yes gene_type:complete
MHSPCQIDARCCTAQKRDKLAKRGMDDNCGIVSVLATTGHSPDNPVATADERRIVA